MSKKTLGSELREVHCRLCICLCVCVYVCVCVWKLAQGEWFVPFARIAEISHNKKTTKRSDNTRTHTHCLRCARTKASFLANCKSNSLKPQCVARAAHSERFDGCSEQKFPDCAVNVNVISILFRVCSDLSIIFLFLFCGGMYWTGIIITVFARIWERTLNLWWLFEIALWGKVVKWEM